MVLIVSQKIKNAIEWSDTFYYMNILSYPCTPGSALKEISTSYNAVLVVEPNDLPDTADFVRRLKSQAPVPIFAVANNPKECRSPYVFDKVFSNSILSGNLAAQMLFYIRDKGIREFGNYVRRGLDIRCTERTPAYFLKYIKLTKTERLILSYLIAARHEHQSPTKILKYAFRYNRKPSISCVRTHISKINKKFEEQMNCKIVGSNPGVGYYIIERPISINEKYLSEIY
jgi:hypothetical protein